MVRFFATLVFLFWVAISTFADVDTSVRIFDKRFKTLKTQVEDNFMSTPVMRMGTNDRLTIKFDEIGEDNSYLEFRLLHCNADWQPSRLVESEYVDGFNSQKIEDYAFSTATYVHYVNYLITIPNEDLQIIHSGNYLLQVYDPDDPDVVLLQTRFQVTENTARIDGNVKTRTDWGHNTEWQQLEFTVDTENSGRLNAFQDLTVIVSQNNRDATRRIIKAPLRISGTQLIYEHLQDLIYPASNEYRRFESVSNNVTGMHVDSLRYMGSNYHVWLKPDAPRVNSQYSYDQTQHGRFMVHEYNATDSDIGADYITVHFMLKTPARLPGEVFIDGEFTNNRFDDFNRMKYDPSERAYKAEIPLKQGSYNYQYVVLPSDGHQLPDPASIEGNKYETGNEYGIAIYYHPPGSRGDRLISYRILE